MTSARFRHMVSLQKPRKTSDGSGGYEVTWEEIAKTAANISPVRSPSRDVERVSGGAISSMPMVQIVVRNDTILSDLVMSAAGYRAVNVDTGESYAVNFVQDFSRAGQELTITATKAEPT